MKRRRAQFTNDYFLAFSTRETALVKSEPVSHPGIPAGYALYRYREVYIPVDKCGGTWVRGAGTNPHTMEVPIHYIANPGGLRRAIKFLREAEQVEQQRARNLRIVENGSAERR